MKKIACALAWLIVAACGRPDVDATPEPSPSSPGAAAQVIPSAATTAPTASAPPSDADAGPESSDDGWTVEPVMDAFVSTLKCNPPGGYSGSTAEMAADGRYEVGCLRTELTARAAALPAAAAIYAMSDAATGGLSHAPAASFARLLDAGCGVSDAAEFTQGALRMAGTMRIDTSAACGMGTLQRALFFVDAWSRAAPGDVVKSVRARSAFAKRAVASFGPVHAGIAHARTLAPDDLVFDDECMFFCMLTEADWRRLELRLQSLEVESRALAGGLCSAWPELERALGGGAACREAIGNDVALHAATKKLVPALGAAVTQSDYVDEPPARDDDARRALEAPIEACWKGESLRYSDDNFDAAALACLRAKSTLSASLEAAWRRFEATSCALEALASAGAPSASDRHTRYVGRDAISSRTCPLAAAGERVVFGSLLGDAGALARHVEGRAAWAAKVRDGATMLEKASASPACKEAWDSTSATCRTRALSAAEWKRLATTRPTLERAASLLAAEACKATDAFPAACNEKLTTYFVSQSVFIGLAAKPPAN